MTTANAKQHRIVFSNGDELIFDHDGKRFRAARYYEMRDDKGENRRVRATATAKTIRDLIVAVFGLDALNDRARELVDYIHSTEWGKDYE